MTPDQFEEWQRVTSLAEDNRRREQMNEAFAHLVVALKPTLPTFGDWSREKFLAGAAINADLQLPRTPHVEPVI